MFIVSQNKSQHFVTIVTFIPTLILENSPRSWGMSSNTDTVISVDHQTFYSRFIEIISSLSCYLPTFRFDGMKRKLYYSWLYRNTVGVREGDEWHDVASVNSSIAFIYVELSLIDLLELIYYFTYFSIVVPSNICVFLSFRPFVVNTFSTGLVGVEVTSVSWPGQEK